CSQEAVIDALKSRGLWPDDPPAERRARQWHSPEPKADNAKSEDVESRIKIALRIWHQSEKLADSPGERYFIERRGLDIRSLDLRHALRWNGGISAVVALMTDPASGQAVGVHRTFLDAEGAKLDRKMLGRQGVVCLSPHSEVVAGLGIT